MLQRVHQCDARPRELATFCSARSFDQQTEHRSRPHNNTHTPPACSHFRCHLSIEHIYAGLRSIYNRASLVLFTAPDSYVRIYQPPILYVARAPVYHVLNETVVNSTSRPYTHHLPPFLCCSSAVILTAPSSQPSPLSFPPPLLPLPTMVDAESHDTAGTNVTAHKSGEGKIPNDTDFQQQRLRAWQPALTPRHVVFVFVVLGILFIPIGAALLYASSTVHYEEARYDLVCGATPHNGMPNPCTFNINITHNMNPPIYFYYKLVNFYQNHRRYVTSQSIYQLHGDSSPDSSDCTPQPPWRYYYGSGGLEQTIYPCGAISGSYFNDTFSATVTPVATPGTVVTLGKYGGDPNSASWEKSGIAYSADLTDLYVNNTYILNDIAAKGNNSQYTRISTSFGNVLPYPQDEDFAVWQRVAALPRFKKQYRIIRCVPSATNPTCNDRSGKLYAGDVLSVTVDNQYDVSFYGGSKYVVVSTVSWLGGKNNFLGAAWITVGGLCFLMAFVFAVATLLRPPPQRVFIPPQTWGAHLTLPDHK